MSRWNEYIETPLEGQINVTLQGYVRLVTLKRLRIAINSRTIRKEFHSAKLEQGLSEHSVV